MSGSVRLPDRRRLQSAWYGLREGRPSEAQPHPPDPETLDLIADPFTSVADAHDRLTALERTFRERGDRRGAFLAIYARVTGEVGQALDRGAFADPDWVAAYLVSFADLYRRALYDYERGALDAVPDPWLLAFTAAAGDDTLVAQDAILGVNAHVNYDLAYALCEVGIDPGREEKYADHCAINDVLRRLVDEVQTRVADDYAPGLADVDEALGRADELLALLTLVEGRDSAWRSAVSLTDSHFGVRRRFTTWLVRTSSTGIAYLLLAPTRSRHLRDRFRAVEGSSSGEDGSAADTGVARE